MRSDADPITGLLRLKRCHLLPFTLI
jgi:hypothetical protein